MTPFILIACLLLSPLSAWAAENEQHAASDDWVRMPAGAKSAYMGIHGGTMPVSLLVSRDGSSLLSFVGKTGNDFLETLRQETFVLPSFGNGTLPRKHAVKTDLFAGNATAVMPVFAADSLPGEEWLKKLVPFGFSPAPLAIEGSPAPPRASSAAKKYRNFYLPGALRLRKK